MILKFLSWLLHRQALSIVSEKELREFERDYNAAMKDVNPLGKFGKDSLKRY